VEAGRRYGGQTAEGRRAQRRAAFIAAGLELFGTRPYPEVSVSDIVEKAGLTRRAFYQLFANREDLLRCVDREEVLARVVEIVREAGEEPPISWPAANRLLRAVLRFYDDDPRRARIAFVAVVGVSDKMEHHHRQAFRALGEAIAPLLGERAGPDSESQRRAAIAVAGAMSELLMDHLWAGDQPFEAVVDELTTLLRFRFFPEQR
jgi:AcrR family transcriptional regulator